MASNSPFVISTKEISYTTYYYNLYLTTIISLPPLFCHLDEGEIFYAIQADHAGGIVSTIKFFATLKR